MFRKRRQVRDHQEGGSPDGGPALVRAAKQNRSQFAVLYRRDVGGIYQFCYSRLGDREAAEDATSEIFERALSHLDQCRDETYRGWLYAIARSVITDMQRADHRLLWLNESAQLVATECDPETETILDERRRDVARAIENLPDEQRTVIELRLAGLKGIEVAEAMHKSHAAVRMLQLRATNSLKQSLRISGEVEAHGHAPR